MDSSNQIPSFEIPKNQDQAQVTDGLTRSSHDNSTLPNGEVLPQPVGGIQQTVPLTSPTQPVAGQIPSVAVPAQIPIALDDAHSIAEDNDVIEKEWVDRAKKIVSLTANDPFIEAKELNKLKATYIKKRFNKDLPLAAGDKTV
jgi:hypothetical protein